jgi:hypothetical protein
MRFGISRETGGGPNHNQTLKSKGDTANLRSIPGCRWTGEVVLSGFLEAEPTNCGSSLSLGPLRQMVMI